MGNRRMNVWVVAGLCGGAGAAIGSGVGIAFAGSAIHGTFPGFLVFFVGGLLVATKWGRLRPSPSRIAIAAIVGVLASVLLGTSMGVVSSGGGSSGVLLVFVVVTVMTFLLLPAARRRTSDPPVDIRPPPRATVTETHAHESRDRSLGSVALIAGILALCFILIFVFALFAGGPLVAVDPPVSGATALTPAQSAVSDPSQPAVPRERRRGGSSTGPTPAHCEYKVVMSDADLAACGANHRSTP